MCNLIKRHGSLHRQCVPASSFQAHPASIEMVPHLTASEQDLTTQAKGKGKQATDFFKIVQQKRIRRSVHMVNITVVRRFLKGKWEEGPGWV